MPGSLASNPPNGTGSDQDSSSNGQLPKSNGDNKSKDDVVNPQGPASSTSWRILSDLFLLLCILITLSWPWVYFGIVKAKGGIQMHRRLADVYNKYPHEVASIVTLVGTVNQFAAIFLLGNAVVRFGQEKLAKSKRVTVFEFNKTAELRGTELDFFSDDPQCLSWLDTNRVRNNCDWKTFGGTQFTTCLGENQMLDVLDSGRANMLSKVIGIKNGTSSLNQLGAEDGIRFLGSAKGILPIGPNGIPAFNSLDPSLNPFEDEYTRSGMVSYNYTLSQQGLESNVSCTYDTASPIRYEAIDEVSTRIISSSGSCDPAAGLEDVLEDVGEYPTLNVNNTLTYWACKQRAPPGVLNPTYVIYLRGRVNYAKSIGNITCTVSPMRSQIFSVDYLSLPGYFVTNPATNPNPQSLQRATFARYIQHGLTGLGNLIWEGQNWSSNIVPEAVFSIATKNFNLSTFEPHPKYLELYGAMLQGILEYEATYSRLVYSLGGNPPPTCLRSITGSVTYSVRGWDISDSFTQAGLLLPMTLINLASLSLLLACFVMGKLNYQHAFDATDNIFLLTAVVKGEDGKEKRGANVEIKWGDRVVCTA
ncbi:hypothetical protein EST38_g1599 [Candolleomyces aberdarensis]|uniref:Uncharacterized protein n=1 Tax=Candolleomyces aberdarensis TaxID=2316362 RepID=A0A4Q2DWL1_9AGAR|nr:hypothetical protein EST38_g1599 [Candolleomyces aberdarensis]